MSETKVVHLLGIDVSTGDASKLISRLKRLSSTQGVENCGAYREDPSWSMVYVDTTKNQGELDDWLYTTKGINYAGVFVRHS